MMIYLISGSGCGAGKTTLADTIVREQNVWSIAAGMRHELLKLYPKYNWFNKSQAYKDNTLVPEYKRGYTVRDVLKEYGQEKSAARPTYWAEKLYERLNGVMRVLGSPQIAIDDVRKMEELNFFKEKYQTYHDLVHFHVENPNATPEPIFDNAQLAKVADYVVRWT